MGRPAQFDKEIAINIAMENFWQNGYNATGVAAIVEAIGIKPSSLYAAFGSKKELFYRALDCYAAMTLTEIEQQLDGQDPVNSLIRLVGDVADGDDSRGCLLVNSLLELGRHDLAVAEHINRHLKDVEGVLKRHIDSAIASQQLAADIDSRSIAACLITQLWGLRVLRQTPDREERLSAVVSQIKALLPLA